MVRETRHLWVGNLPDNIREDRIREHFKRYGRVQNVKLLGRTDTPTPGVGGSSVGGPGCGICATVAFMDIKSASKAHNAEHVLDERTLTTEYYEPAAIPSAAAGAQSAGSSPAGSGYSGSSSSVNSTPAPGSSSRYHLSGGEETVSATCPLAASAAAPANWRGTNDSATEYCRRGSTPAYSRYQRNNASNTPYSTPPSNVERTTTPHARWHGSGGGGESTPSTPSGGGGGGAEGSARRVGGGSCSSRSESSSPEPSDTSRASTPLAAPPASAHHHHRNHIGHHHQWSSATASGRPLAICVRNLPTRSTDSSLKDGLYHEYKKHGKVVWVKVVGQNADRYAVVRFKKPSDVEKALEVSQDKLFFGCKISVAPHQSCEEDAETAKPYETDIDEYHPKATRTLFIGNLEKDVTQQQLREKFKQFGRIIEIDIKKGSGGGVGYAFCQYASISSVVEAIRAMDGEYVGGSRLKLGFGKPVATACVRVDNLTEHTEKQVLAAVSRCGSATSVCVDRAAGAALVHFEQAAAATAAVRELRRVAAAAASASASVPLTTTVAATTTAPAATTVTAAVGTTTVTATTDSDAPRLSVDYASRECQEAFYEQLEKHGGSAALAGSERLLADRYLPGHRHEQIRYEGGRGSRASSYTRGGSRTPAPVRYPDHYDSPDYAAERRYRVYEELGSSPPVEDPSYDDRLQSVVVSPHRMHRHRRDSTPEERKHSKERHRSSGHSRRSRSTSRGECARRRHRRRRSGRSGTPLRDEPPAEPRPKPRDPQPRPMSLPLPRFAAQLRAAPRIPPARPSTTNSAASSTSAAPTSPPRARSASSDSAPEADRDREPSLDDRIRELDEKYERWSGTRAPAAAVLLLTAQQPTRNPRPRHRLLDLDLTDVKPSDVVRSLLAKRSVFDEDSERLEGARAPSPTLIEPRTPRLLLTSSSSMLTTPLTPRRRISLLESDSTAQSAAVTDSLIALPLDSSTSNQKDLEAKLDSEIKLELSNITRDAALEAAEAERRLKDETEVCGDDRERKACELVQLDPVSRASPVLSVLVEPALFPRPEIGDTDEVIKNETKTEDIKKVVPVSLRRESETKLDNHKFDRDKIKIEDVEANNKSGLKIKSLKDELKYDKVDSVQEKQTDECNKRPFNINKEHVPKECVKLNKIHCDIKSDRSKSEHSSKEIDHPHQKHSEDRHRHEHKEKSDKSKRRDSRDESNKSKKDDKSKHEKSKKEHTEPKTNKKESESKQRKSSRDESCRDLYRKDSTDSSTSKASQDSSKHKETENSQTKDDEKSKQKVSSEFLPKIKSEKDVSSKSECVLKIEDIKVKTEKEVKPPSKLKSEYILDIKTEQCEKPRHYSLDSPSSDKRKERLNSSSSLPCNLGSKRRKSSQDSFDSICDVVKKIKTENEKCLERRDSKDSRSNERHKTTKFSKGHFVKIIESKSKDDKKNQVKPPDDSFLEWGTFNDDKNKIVKKEVKIKEEPIEAINESSDSHSDELRNSLDFLATLELRSSEEDEKQKALRKEMKEKKRIQQLQQIQELQMKQDARSLQSDLNKKDDKKHKCDEKRKEGVSEKRLSTERKSRDEKIENKKKNRKQFQSTDSSDSDEPKKHSIFDIVDDGPTYISMYDKVKARSCKNMQKQEEEKRQEKIKAKFSQLKQSRAKREEKKRSSWDEDSESDRDHPKSQKLSMDSSSDDDHEHNPNKTDLNHLSNDFFNASLNADDVHSKLFRKNSRTRIISDTSDDDRSKRSISKSPSFLHQTKKEFTFDSESLHNDKFDLPKEVIHCDKIKKHSLLNLFGKSDSDESKFKSSFENDDYKINLSKSYNDISSESDTLHFNKYPYDVPRKHKKKQKKHKSSFSDNELRQESDTTDSRTNEHKHLDKARRHGNKKEKRKDRIRESMDKDESRENKLKHKPKNLTNCLSLDTPDELSNVKKEGKLEDIFGPLSDDSDKECKDLQRKSSYSFHNDSFLPSNSQSNEEIKIRDETRRKREKKRKEKRHFSKEDDNSLDVDAVSKAIEARLFADSIADAENISGKEIKHLHDKNNIIEDVPTVDSFDKSRKESREKKKKKKKNREDRQSRKEHQNFHHDKSIHLKSTSILQIDISTNTLLLDIPLPSDTKIENENIDKPKLESPSLPCLTESPPMVIQDEDYNIKVKSSENLDIDFDNSKNSNLDITIETNIQIEEIPMPPPINNIVHDISEVPLPTEPLPERLSQSNAGTSISYENERDSENAVRGIPTSENVIETELQNANAKQTKTEEKADDKARAVISQEETEDAVAALLGESFGGKADSFSSCFDEEENNSSNANENTTVESETIPDEVAEEMRQAVQNLNACEMEAKPDTPLSDNDLLLIDTDTEEADENSQDIEKVSEPAPIVATATIDNEAPKNKQTLDVQIPKTSASALIITRTESNESNLKLSDTNIRLTLAKRDQTQHITAPTTPVITSWTLTNNKLLEPHLVSLHNNHVGKKEDSKPVYASANIVQIKTTLNQNLHLNNAHRPVIATNRVTAPYQVINQVIRPRAPNMQPPTIKIPDSHILYQKQQGIVMSPRLSNCDSQLLSPKSQQDVTSPRISNLTLLNTSSTNINSIGMVSPTSSLQQRNPGHVTVVRMQQPPLSPIQAIHLPHGNRALMSPNRSNSVLVQAQAHFNRLPVTPVLAPISKPINAGNIVQTNKSIVVSTANLIQQQKKITIDGRTDQNNFTEINDSKIILSPTSMQQNMIVAQNRLMNASNLSPQLQLTNKLVINNIHQLNEKREIKIKVSEQQTHLPFATSTILNAANVTKSTPSIIQSGSIPLMTNIHDMHSANRSQSSNVIHTFASQRLATAPITNLIQVDGKKTPTTVLPLASMKPTTVLTKIDSAITTNCLTNVVMTPVLLKPVSSSVISNSKKDNISPTSIIIPNQLIRTNDLKSDNVQQIFKINEPSKFEGMHKNLKDNNSTSAKKSETDFEELLKDNTNEIKVSNEPNERLEVKTGKSVITVSDKQNKVDNCIGDTVSLLSLKPNTTEDNINNKVEIKSKEEYCFQKFSKDDKNVNLELENNLKITPTSVPIHLIATSSTTITINQKPISNFVSDFDSDKGLKLDENDSWSAKDLNIESVIKKVDTLCNDSIELNEKPETTLKTNQEPRAFESISNNKTIVAAAVPPKPAKLTSLTSEIDHMTAVGQENFSFDKSNITNSSKRGGRNVRGKKTDKNPERVQTRQISKPTRGAGAKRGRGRAKVDKKIKTSASNEIATHIPGDIYDFHEDSGDEIGSDKKEPRPRLILTIKSPLSGLAAATATSSLSIGQQKDQSKPVESITKEEKSEGFISPPGNTRKSRRLQEKDVQRTVTDDSGEDGPRIGRGKKRPARVAVVKQLAGITTPSTTTNQPDTRKSPRGVKRKRDRSISDPSSETQDEPSPKVAKLDNALSVITKDSETTRVNYPNPSMEIASTMTPSIVTSTASVLVCAPTAAPPTSTPATMTMPAHNQTPIMKPPKKMISEISAKLASAFEAAAAENRHDKSMAAAEAGDASTRAGGAAAGAGEARVQSPAPPPAAASLPRGALLHPPRAHLTQHATHPVHPAHPAHPAYPAHHHAPPKQVAVVPPSHHHPGTAGSRVTVSVPTVSPQKQMPTSDLARSPPPAHQQTSPITGDGMYPHFSQQHYQMYQQHFRATQIENRTTPSPYTRALEAEACSAPIPALELHRAARPAHSPAPAPAPTPAHDRLIVYGGSAGGGGPAAGGTRAGPPHASQVPRDHDSLQVLLTRYPVMWQGLLALKNDSAAVQMHFVGGNPHVAADTLPRHTDGSTPPLRIAQRMRLEPVQLDQVHRKMKMGNEHCMLLALPCGRDHMDVLQQSTNLTGGFITYLQRKQAAGIVNVAPPGHNQAMYTVHIFPSCDFANENLNRIAPDLMHRVADIAHLLIVIATV